MADAWRNGELESLSAELLDDFEQFPGLYETLVTERNQAWVPTLERMLADGGRCISSSSGRCTSSAATASSSCCAHAATTWCACTERSR